MLLEQTILLTLHLLWYYSTSHCCEGPWDLCVIVSPRLKAHCFRCGVGRESKCQYNKMPGDAQSFWKHHYWPQSSDSSCRESLHIFLCSPKNIVLKTCRCFFFFLNMSTSSRWFLLKYQTANRTIVCPRFPVSWLIIAFQSEWLLETGQRSLCVSMFSPCCLPP